MFKKVPKSNTNSGNWTDESCVRIIWFGLHLKVSHLEMLNWNYFIGGFVLLSTAFNTLLQGKQGYWLLLYLTRNLLNDKGNSRCGDEKIYIAKDAKTHCNKTDLAELMILIGTTISII